MFIIPVGNRVDWKRPPLVTVLLILINCFVFFALQGGDQRSAEKASNYYFSSQLPNWELPRYAQYLEQNGTAEDAQDYRQLLDKKDTFALPVMEHDTKFMHELRAGLIITALNTEYPDWSSQRKQFEAMASFTERYVYRVDEPSALTAFTSVFMHGGFDHLFGNMVVLFLVGFMVESVVGKRLFLLAYLVSAYAAIFMFSLSAHGGSLLGASGAIAGVMGLYTAIFGLRKIDFFYSLGFYFDYVRAPAIALLPLWLGNEAYQFFNNHGSNVAYMAHFGGLLCGAAMGGLYRWRKPAMIEQRYQERDANEQEDQSFQKGMALLGAMEFQKAHLIFNTLYEKHPQDMNLARLCYRTAKHDPAGADYHRAALRMLSLPGADATTSQQTHEIFHEYLNIAKPAPRLVPDLVAKLAQRFAVNSQFDDAERLCKLLQRTAPLHAELPAVLLAMARGHYRAERKESFKQTLEAVIAAYPESKEAATAADMLRVA